MFNKIGITRKLIILTKLKIKRIKSIWLFTSYCTCKTCAVPLNTRIEDVNNSIEWYCNPHKKDFKGTNEEFAFDTRPGKVN